MIWTMGEEILEGRTGDKCRGGAVLDFVSKERTIKDIIIIAAKKGGNTRGNLVSDDLEARSSKHMSPTAQARVQVCVRWQAIASAVLFTSPRGCWS